MKESRQISVADFVGGFGDLTVNGSREAFERLESAVLSLDQIPDSDYSLKEYVSGGMYVREITIPKGALITGRIYKFDHIEIMVSGKVTILSANGGKTDYSGHNVIEAKAGKRQAGLAHEETKWITINCIPDNLPISEALDFTSVLTFSEYKQFHEKVNRADFDYFINEIGISDSDMQAIVKTDDVITMPFEHDHIIVEESGIHGSGLFTKKKIKAGEIICPVRIGNNRTIAGRYSNHALHSNTKPIVINGVFCIKASVDIQEMEEITMNYRDVLSFRAEQGDLLCQVG